MNTTQPFLPRIFYSARQTYESRTHNQEKQKRNREMNNEYIRSGQKAEDNRIREWNKHHSVQEHMNRQQEQ